MYREGARGGHNPRGRRGGGPPQPWDRYDDGYGSRPLGQRGLPDGDQHPPPPPPPARSFYAASANPSTRRGNANFAQASFSASRRVVGLDHDDFHRNQRNFSSAFPGDGSSGRTPPHGGSRRNGVPFASRPGHYADGDFARHPRRGRGRSDWGRRGAGARFCDPDGRRGENDASESSMQEAPDAPLPPSAYCRNFAFSGQCKFGVRCRYSHSLQCVGWALEAHAEQPITCSAVNSATADGVPEVFTGGKDRFVRRWAVVVAQAGNPTASPGASGDEASLWLEFECRQEVAVDSEPTTMFFTEGVLFVGLQNGLVLALMPSGELKQLRRHGSAVHALVAIDAVLVSAEWEGRICVWKFENNDFVIAKELDVPGKLTCLKDLCVARPLGDSATAPTPGDTERRFLWAGGTGLTIIDLASMNVVCSLDISDSACARGRERRPMPLALSLVAYESSMLVGFSSGVVKAYSASGQEQFRYDKSAYLSTMAGVMSPDGPLLLFGGPRGAFHALTLPQFEETGQLSAHEEGDVKSILFLSSEFFVTCGEDSVICVWRWAKPQTASSAPS
ncbi:zinc finger (CCCH type) motif-containing protein [Toxoplasma gondii RUB]|uniref:Zinc finger (CCCH type) motif-containing protein n=1 Tax=Toxoplasma gondii RUB TaxID=935652 RepID=A0A086M7U3_TOXGO|nr:zinc finger (CCCH type) motif-containing protein [Toxoplasma gondii RUB]